LNEEINIMAKLIPAPSCTKRCKESVIMSSTFGEFDNWSEADLMEIDKLENQFWQADAIICKKGTEVYLPDSKTIDITSEEMIWVGLQVKTGSAVLSTKSTNKFPCFRFNGFERKHLQLRRSDKLLIMDHKRPRSSPHAFKRESCGGTRTTTSTATCLTIWRRSPDIWTCTLK